MIWKEKGVDKDSYLCFFNPQDGLREYFYYMLSCGYFHTNGEYLYESAGNRPPLFFYIISGTLHLEYEGQSYAARENEIVLINCRKYHKYYCTDHCEFLFFHFDGNQAVCVTEHLTASNHSPVFHLKQPRAIYHSIYEPIMRLCYQEQSSDALLSALVYSTLCRIYEACESGSVSAVPSNCSEPVARSIDYMKTNIGRQLPLDELSKSAGLSPFYFSRLFRKETGFAPIEYFAITKINYAKLMLRTTNASISEIADSLGYSSSASFINAFKARRGMSPNQYRHTTEYELFL